ncbi:DUF167 domain-containing protein [Candidatus Woesearchaeota archaeon]|nr:DUF167 domain-containing protein [Candidatus Woesearchaeota archaeon]
MKKIIQVTVKTNTPETKITKQEGDKWRMDVHAQPENNKANLEIIKFLSKTYKANVTITCGLRSKEKTILILNAKKDPDQNV